MIKALGIAFFSLLGLGLLAMGWVQHQPVALAMGGMTFFFVLVLVLGSTVWRKWMDTRESGKAGMKVIRKAIVKSAGGDGP